MIVLSSGGMKKRHQRMSTRLAAFLFIAGYGLLLSSRVGAQSESRGFQLYDNYDMVGAVLRERPLSDVATCMSDCEKDSQCAAFGFDKWKRICALKSAANSFRFDPSV